MENDRHFRRNKPGLQRIHLYPKMLTTFHPPSHHPRPVVKMPAGGNFSTESKATS